MAIPKILLIRRQLSLNYSLAQRKNLNIHCKKNENKQTSKRKTKTKTNRRLDGPYTDPLRRGRTIGQSMQREREYKRTLHPYRRRSCAVVFSSLDPAQEQRRSRYHHFSFGTLRSQYAHGKSQTLSCFLCHTGIEVSDLKSAMRHRVLWETRCEAFRRTSKDDDDWCTGLVTWFDWAVKSRSIVTKINSTSTENNFASQPCSLSYSFVKRSSFLYGLIALRF